MVCCNHFCLMLGKPYLLCMMTSFVNSTFLVTSFRTLIPSLKLKWMLNSGFQSNIYLENKNSARIYVRNSGSITENGGIQVAFI